VTLLIVSSMLLLGGGALTSMNGSFFIYTQGRKLIPLL
jgi:hypothetical protein